MSNASLTSILKQIESLTLEEKKVLFNHLDGLTQKELDNTNEHRLMMIKTHPFEILALADHYGCSNVSYFIDKTEVIFVVNLAEDKTLFDLGGLLQDLQELLGFKVVVFTEKMLKEPYQSLILQQAIKL